MAFVQRFQKFIHKGTQNGLQYVGKTIGIVKEGRVDIKI
jgi:hypothetical protein